MTNPNLGNKLSAFLQEATSAQNNRITNLEKSAACLKLSIETLEQSIQQLLASVQAAATQRSSLAEKLDQLAYDLLKQSETLLSTQSRLVNLEQEVEQIKNSSPSIPIELMNELASLKQDITKNTEHLLQLAPTLSAVVKLIGAVSSR